MNRLGVVVISLLMLLAAVGLSLTSASNGAVNKPERSPWLGSGIWVWYLPEDQEQMVERLKAMHIQTVYIKSADGVNPWEQLTTEVVDRLHRADIQVCGWQYVYGDRPLAEARAAARAKQVGADCFVIDAESEYENNKRYQARVYLKELRRLVGKKYQLGFTSFPYTNLHSKMPYDIFLGPGGAQANLPQMYWKEIGITPRKVLYDTWNKNLALRRPVYPIGQAYQNPNPDDVRYFIRKLRSVNAGGISFWSLDHIDQKTEAVLRQENKATNALGKKMSSSKQR